MRTPVNVGVVGVGRSAAELVRTFGDLPHARLCWLCDHSLEPQLRLSSRYPSARVTSDLQRLLSDETLDAVVIATPAATHYELVRRALEAEKHVFVETPLARESQQAEELVRLAQRCNLRLMVGHVLVFHPAVRKLKELIELGRLGDVYYFSGGWHAVGDRPPGENALWSLGAEQLSVLLHLVDDEPVEVLARGDAYIEPGCEDVVVCYLRFATGISAHLHLSSLDPLKLRKLTAVGSKRTAVFDDVEPDRKLTIYQTTFARRAISGPYARAGVGDVHSPAIDHDEPLRLACERFVEGVASSLDFASARQGAAVVRTLEALQESLDRGKPSISELPRGTPRVVALRRLPR